MDAVKVIYTSLQNDMASVASDESEFGFAW